MIRRMTERRPVPRLSLLPAKPGETIDRAALGRHLRAIRRARGWTLQEVSHRTGLAVSTISKAERGLIGLAYDKFILLAQKLELDVSELFQPGGRGYANTTLSVTRAGGAPTYETETYVYRMLASDLRSKRMVPMWGKIKAHDARAFSDFISHPGEEFLFVLDGTLTVHLEDRAPIKLERHDSMYFDSAIGHVYVSAGAEDTTILVVCVDDPPGN